MGRKKPFIKKGEGVKFYLVHRSQKDPLYLDETLGEHVLVPADPDQEKLIHVMNELHLNEPTTSAAGASGESKRNKRIEEQHKYGIYFEDDYNYMQHLKEVRPDDEDEEEANTAEPIKIGSVLVRSDREDDASAAARKAGKLVLPSTVFASKYEEEVGYFNQAAPDHDPKINWDPDIVRLLDEDANIDAEEQIEDDFFIKANGEKDDSDEDTINNDDDDDEDDDDERDVGSDDGRFDPDFDDSDPERKSVRDFETKSRFSNYSMSSSVIRRNKGLQHLDECFEKLFSEYDDDQIGSLDTDDIEGYRKSDLVLEAALSEFSKYIQKGQYTAEPRLETVGERSEDDEDEDEENDDEELLEYEKKKEKEDRFDCETIISTYSTLYNHPSIIKEEPKKRIELSKKSGLPLGVLHEKAKSQKEIERLNHKITRITPEELNVDVNTKRNPNESKEEKKARKQAIKEHRRERRVEKKINKLAFKEEKKVQIGQINNAMVNKTLVKLPL